MKGKLCEVQLNSSWGYMFASKVFPSIRQAEKYARDFIGGFYWTIYEVVDCQRGKKIKSGYCRGL